MRRILIMLALLAPAGLALADPPPQRTEEYRRPSGFWGSTRPATHGAYRYRLLGIGVVLVGITGFVMLRLVKKANAERAKR